MGSITRVWQKVTSSSPFFIDRVRKKRTGTEEINKLFIDTVRMVPDPWHEPLLLCVLLFGPSWGPGVPCMWDLLFCLLFVHLFYELYQVWHNGRSLCLLPVTAQSNVSVSITGTCPPSSHLYMYFTVFRDFFRSSCKILLLYRFRRWDSSPTRTVQTPPPSSPPRSGDSPGVSRNRPKIKTLIES